MVFTTVGFYACWLDLVGPLANSLLIVTSALSEPSQTLVSIYMRGVGQTGMTK